MRFINLEQTAERFRGRRVAVVGSAPSVMDNEPGRVDSYDLVVRVNNYKTGGGAGQRADVFYSYFGNSIKKTPDGLAADGVKLCICKCPNSKPIESAWHEENNKTSGIDFQWIYKKRMNWWFCDTFVPDDATFMKKVGLLGGHIPTTGFAAILDILSFKPAELYVTGFDFFESGVHNVDERWLPGRADDPIRHLPHEEFRWLADNHRIHGIKVDAKLDLMFEELEMMRT